MRLVVPAISQQQGETTNDALAEVALCVADGRRLRRMVVGRLCATLVLVDGKSAKWYGQRA